jgi:hypothetical protein
MGSGVTSLIWTSALDEGEWSGSYCDMFDRRPPLLGNRS